MDAISLFSGAGGMDVGFVAAGFQILWANDIDPDACASFAANHGGIITCGDISKLLPNLSNFNDIDVVFGGPPCQGFSVAGKMNPNDPRNKLMWVFMDAIQVIRPKAFVCENVKALATLEKWQSVREALLKTAHDLGYRCRIIVLSASQFGVPQARERMFLLGFRSNYPVEEVECLLGELHQPSPTVRDVFLNLGIAGSSHNKRACRAKVTIASKPVLRRSPYAGMLFNGQGRPLCPDRYASTLPATMGGNRTPIIDELHLYHNQPSWVEWYHAYLLNGGKPLASQEAPGRLRRLTVDEALRLQTFPDDYVFIGKQSSVFRQIGNAVPCKLAEALALTLRAILSSETKIINAA